MLTRFERTRILDQQRHMRQALVALTGSGPGAEQANRFALLFRLLVQFELLAASLYRLRAEEVPGQRAQSPNGTTAGNTASTRPSGLSTPIRYGCAPAS